MTFVVFFKEKSAVILIVPCGNFYPFVVSELYVFVWRNSPVSFFSSEYLSPPYTDLAFIHIFAFAYCHSLFWIAFLLLPLESLFISSLNIRFRIFTFINWKNLLITLLYSEVPFFWVSLNHIKGFDDKSKNKSFVFSLDYCHSLTDLTFVFTVNIVYKSLIWKQWDLSI